MKILLLLVLLSFGLRSDFKTQQLKNERVKLAYAQKFPGLSRSLQVRNLQFSTLEIYLQVFKQEQVLEVWARNKADKQFQLLRSIPFCTTSGTLGPKNKQGDRQIPEGFYFIDRFHPESKYFLSLGINYPNAADRARSFAQDLGGDIFIHGKCASWGCISITDPAIMELYVLAVEAQQNGQTQIPVHFYPARLTANGLAKLREFYAWELELIAFWQDLKVGYDHFQQHRTVPQVRVNEKGNYVLGN